MNHVANPPGIAATKPKRKMSRKKQKNKRKFSQESTSSTDLSFPSTPEIIEKEKRNTKVLSLSEDLLNLTIGPNIKGKKNSKTRDYTEITDWEKSRIAQGQKQVQDFFNRNRKNEKNSYEIKEEDGYDEEELEDQDQDQYEDEDDDEEENSNQEKNEIPDLECIADYNLHSMKLTVLTEHSINRNGQSITKHNNEFKFQKNKILINGIKLDNYDCPNFNKNNNDNCFCKHCLFNKPTEISQRQFNVRKILWSLYDSGVMMDIESWQFVTPELIAQHIAYLSFHYFVLQQPSSLLFQSKKNKKPTIVMDPFCGTGGNAIQYAKYFDFVLAIDIDPLRIKMAQKNAEIYGVSHKIQFYCGDSMKLLQNPSFINSWGKQQQTINQTQTGYNYNLYSNVNHILGIKNDNIIDIVFLSPPWGGQSYKKQKYFKIKNMGDKIDGQILFNLVKQFTDHIVYFLPKNCPFSEMRSLVQGDPKYSNVSIYDHKTKQYTKNKKSIAQNTNVTATPISIGPQKGCLFQKYGITNNWDQSVIKKCCAAFYGI